MSPHWEDMTLEQRLRWAQNNSLVRMPLNIDSIIAHLLTKPQQREIKRMTRAGYNKTQAVRKLLRLGMLVRQVDDLETDLIHGTRYALRDGKGAA